MRKFLSIFKLVDMTVGAPLKKIVIFTIPMLFGNMVQQLYTTADSIIVGRYLGDNALAAVGSVAPIVNLLLVFFMGISGGVGIMISQYFGSRNRNAIAKTIGSAITVTAISSVFLIILTLPFVRKLLLALNTPEILIDDGVKYLSVMLLGIGGMSYYNIFTGILRGLGDSFSALLYLVIATILNIALDILFVKYLHMGVFSASLATCISQSLSALLCFFKILQMRNLFTFSANDLLPEKKYISEIIRLGTPSGINQVIYSSSMIIVQSLTNCFGEVFIAANVIITRIDAFAMMPNFSFGIALSTFAGQNAGAGRYDRIEKGAKEGMGIAICTAALITIMILLFDREIISVFTSTPQLIDMSVYLFRIIAIGYVLIAITQCISGVMHGAGDTAVPMWISICSSVFIRIPLAYGISYFTRSEYLPFGKSECIPISLVASWFFGVLLNIYFYMKKNWRNKHL